MLGLMLGVLLAIDPVHSKAAFSVQHIFVEKVEGSLPVVRGSIELAEGTLVPNKVSAELDATKLRTGDDDRDGVLQTSDWFDTKAFPTWNFVSEKISSNAQGFTMTGLLTIHGVSREEVLEVTASGTSANPVYYATCHVDRHAFGMKPNRMDAAIGTDVLVTLDIRAH